MAGATALRAAMARKGMNGREVGDKLGVSNSRVNNWSAARSGIPAPYAQKLGKLLGLEDWRVLDNSPVGKRERKPVAKKSTRQEAPGPAQRAVMLLEAREAHPNGHAVQMPSKASHGAGPGMGGVFGMQANADGTMAVWVRAADLPFDKGSALVRLLLDMGLVPGAANA
jgi:transcriptional regulator with XRE-family HTH domain